MTLSNGHDGSVSVRRSPFDSHAYRTRMETSGCFVCRIASDGEGEHVVYRDQHHIAFLPRFHVQLGYVLVAPVEHREAVVDDFTTDEYLALQRVVRRVTQAMTGVVPTERIYIASLGSQEGNAHVHWHVVALPPGVPFEEQQFRAMMPETHGVLDVSKPDRVAFSEQLRAAIGTQA